MTEPVLHQGDCVEVMAAMEAGSVDAIVTDPPYGLEFMGKSWDRLGDVGTTSHAGPVADGGAFGRVSYYGSSNVKCRTCGRWQWDHVGRRCECEVPDFPSVKAHQGRLMGAWHARWAAEALRVAKPSSYLLAFGGTRTVHRLTVALEDAGWVIRDLLVWAYASGFPKSKASLKPAWEPIVMARKPGPARDLAIDLCRLPMTDADAENFERGSEAWYDLSMRRTGGAKKANEIYGVYGVPAPSGPHEGGRWPANVMLTDPIFDGGVEGVVGGGEASSGSGWAGAAPSATDLFTGVGGVAAANYTDEGTYSRFFLVPKAARSDREPVLGGLPKAPVFAGRHPDNPRCRTCGRYRIGHLGAPFCECPEPDWTPVGDTHRANTHPTVKPTDLMRHLVRLVTPAGGVVLDPFLGSGTTAIAAEMEGFGWVGIEREGEYVDIARARLNGVQMGLGLT